MLEYFELSPPSGYPDHSHAGFEAVTYILENNLAHQDSVVNSKALLGSFALQYINAGRGLMHAQMPAQEDVKGFQFWVNTPREKKNAEPNIVNLERD